ncbi:hypothetical protein RJ640_025358 [Escallonia rubra]|uniref:HIT domain-containing protein n=1 Tax=Escallonia rubra TaxID=112253 RepID=A0AA88QQX1_9ASTE|nr:hypothetical protein RJ640_025358 [Escallonia rubra]
MEARRRLALIASHLRPITSTPECSTTRVSTSHCHSDSAGHDANQVTDCVFCKIVHGEAPALKLYEDDICICILDTFPLSHGHSLIIPKCHFSSLEATPPSVVAAMCSKVPYISNAVMKATACDSFNLLVNSGTAAGQVIFHSLRRRPLRLDQEASRLADCVREQLSFSGKSEDSKGQASSHVED